MLHASVHLLPLKVPSFSSLHHFAFRVVSISSYIFFLSSFFTIFLYPSNLLEVLAIESFVLELLSKRTERSIVCLFVREFFFSGSTIDAERSNHP